MLKWKIENSVLSELIYKDVNIIEPWGIETADSSAFFSLEDGVGYRYKVIDENYQANSDKYDYKVHTLMREGEWILSGTDFIASDKKIVRDVNLSILKKSFIMDFVMRFRFKKKYFNYCEIGGRKIFHNNSNTFYQYPVQNVSIVNDNYRINLNLLSSIVPEKFELVAYVRDREDEWIIHFRMIPKIWDKEVIKLCNKWYKTRPLPSLISRIILKNRKARKKLWYRGEINPYKNKLLRLINPNAYPMSLVEVGTVFKINVEMEVV